MKNKLQSEIIEDFAKKLKDINPFIIFSSNIQEEELNYIKGYNDHYEKINSKIDEIVEEFKQNTN